MIINRAYKTKLRPTKKQASYFGGCCGAARYVFNWALADRKATYESGGKPNMYEQKRRFNATKSEICPWIGDYPYALMEAEFMHVDRAYQNFFRRVKEGKAGKEVGFPKFKKRGSKNSFTLRGIRIEEGRIRLPKIGWVKLAEKGYMPTDGAKINSATVTEYAADWFVSVQVETLLEDGPPLNGDVIGVDVGVKSLAVLSDGRMFNNPKTLYQHEKKMAHLSRELSRRQLGGKNWRKTKAKIAKLHRKIAMVRMHTLHDISAAVVDGQAGLIGLEDLNIKGMLKNGHLARAISDSGLGELHRQVMYKSEWAGAEVVLVDRWYPSSKTCSSCGVVKEDLTLGDRVFICDGCGAEMDRDLNAAKNIAAYVERVKRAGLPVELDGLPFTEKQEGGVKGKTASGDGQPSPHPF